MIETIKKNIPTAIFYKILIYCLLSVFIPNIPTIPTKNNNVYTEKIFNNGNTNIQLL
jgi:hypothetical protein